MNQEDPLKWAAVIRSIIDWTQFTRNVEQGTIHRMLTFILEKSALRRRKKEREAQSVLSDFLWNLTPQSLLSHHSICLQTYKVNAPFYWTIRRWMCLHKEYWFADACPELRSLIRFVCPSTIPGHL